MAKQLPSSSNGLRACLSCRLIKNQNQFLQEGCDNCERYFEVKTKRDRLDEYTSSRFSGLVAIVNQTDGWVRRWQRMDETYVLGVYAKEVCGILSESLQFKLKRRS